MIIRDDEDGMEIDLESFFKDDYESIFPKPVYSAPPMPECKPHKPTAEEMLKKALDYTETQITNVTVGSPSWSYDVGRVIAYQDIAAYLEMLIKEVEQNG